MQHGPCAPSIAGMDALEGWSEFNVAMVGATAALAGLVIVAASVNISDIVASRTLTTRLGSAIVTLVVALAVSALGLVPAIDALWYGILVLVLAVIALAFQLVAARRLAEDPDPRDSARVLKALLGFLPVTAFVLAGVLTFVTQPVALAPAALASAAVGVVLAIASAITVSWVALVEVLR